MEKSVILKLSLVVLAVALCGCQTLGVGASDEELISTTMAEWKAAMVAKDLDRLMATFSDNYVSARGSGKDSMRVRLAGAIERGFLDSVEVNIEDAQIAIEGDKATLSPVEFTSTEALWRWNTHSRRKTGPGS